MKFAKLSSRPRRWALKIIILLLVSSGVVRLTGDTGRALAREVSEMGGAGADIQKAEALVCPPGTEMAEMMVEINERDTALTERQIVLEDLEQRLAQSKFEIEDKIQTMIETEAALSATMALANGAAENDLAQLTTLYESMKPNDAAALFAEMDPEFSSGFLARMRPEAAASVMAGLEPQVAYAISVILAGRNANVPTN